MTILQVLEAAVWAVGYRIIAPDAQFESFEEAMYYSMITFSTLGYGDVVLENPYRLLNGIQAINGTLIFGWSTVLFFTFLQNLWERYYIDENQE